MFSVVPTAHAGPDPVQATSRRLARLPGEGAGTTFHEAPPHCSMSTPLSCVPTANSRFVAGPETENSSADLLRLGLGMCVHEVPFHRAKPGPVDAIPVVHTSEGVKAKMSVAVEKGGEGSMLHSVPFHCSTSGGNPPLRY